MTTRLPHHPVGYPGAVSAGPESDHLTPDQRRDCRVRARLSYALVLVLVGVAVWAAVQEYVFFPIVLAVLAVFATVEARWTAHQGRPR